MYYSIQHKRNRKNNLIYKISLTLGILILILAIPLSFILPPSIGFENGIIENFQIVVLTFSCIHNLILIKHSTDKQIGYFHSTCSLLTFIIILREISWGRVFYQIGTDENGPIFVDMSDYIFKYEAHIIIVLLVILLLWILIKKFPVERLIKSKAPLIVITLMIISIILSSIGEHLQSQIIEELCELSLYILIPAFYIHYHRKI